MAFARLIVARGREEFPSLAEQPVAPPQPVARLPGQRLVIEREVRLRGLAAPTSPRGPRR
eukprot:13348768-Alexandrium_andersonii.AAC.1